MQHDRRIVISLFDYSGRMVAPWAAAGYICYCVDLQHPAGASRVGNVVQVGADVREWLPPFGTVEILFAFPPCTHVAVSGARWFQDKGLRGLIQALQLFEAAVRLAEWTGAPYVIENPVSTVATYWRKPDHHFDPCDFGGYLDPPGDAYTKRTCLWTGNGFRMPPARRIPPDEGSRMHKLGPSTNRQNLRSETPRGFAQAVFETNHGWSMLGRHAGSSDSANCATSHGGLSRSPTSKVHLGGRCGDEPKSPDHAKRLGPDRRTHRRRGSAPPDWNDQS